MNRFSLAILALCAVIFCRCGNAAEDRPVFLEAEGFADTGGWTNDNLYCGKWFYMYY